MSTRPAAIASLPPEGITGMNPAWSRLVTTVDCQGKSRTWHLLDSWAEQLPTSTAPAITLLCVHGNPSWSFLWRHMLARLPHTIRVIAVDQLDMGYSERTGVRRTLTMRIRDLCLLTENLELTGPVVTLAHDWGGPISLGWALKHHMENKSVSRSQLSDKPHLAGVILTNTAVHQPESASAPSVIRFIRLPMLLRLLTVHTRAFISGAVRMSKPALADEVNAGFHAPYRQASRRAAIADFVADIPLSDQHESASALTSIASGLAKLGNTPAMLLWGPRDRVFNDIYLNDLESRLPHADVHRYPHAAHFVTEDEDVVEAVSCWLSEHFDLNVSTAKKSSNDLDNNSACTPAGTTAEPLRALADFTQTGSDTLAVVEHGPRERTISFGELADKVQLLATGMSAFGMVRGDRVAVMIMPGVDLSIVVYACWRLGVTLVLVDSGLGKQGMQQALHSARPDYLIGIDKALIAARVLGWPGKRISLTPCSATKAHSLAVVSDVESLCLLGDNEISLPWPTPDTIAVVAFTSGSTGPSKGVVYQHRHVQAQREALMNLYGISSDDRLVAAFAPFALYGPTMGISSMVPDMDVTKPGTLTARALASAVARIRATLVFASPAALVNVVETKPQLSTDTQLACSAVRLALSAGAPVRASLLEACSTVFPNASWHTPYGMTEVLPVADISLEELQKTGTMGGSLDTAFGDQSIQSAGVCVGFPLQGVCIGIDPLDQMGVPSGTVANQSGILGEIIVTAEHIRHGYDRLWHTEYIASQPVGAHRTGDVGQLDADGRLWVGGRLGHVVVTSDGPLAPVACEQIIETIDGVDMAAVVGVGPVGTQAVVAVVQSRDGRHPAGGASLELVDLVRQSVQSIVDIAAVLVIRHLPVDRRHNSKVDRSAVAQWAERVLAGERTTSL